MTAIAPTSAFHTGRVDATDFVPFDYLEPATGMVRFGQIAPIRKGGAMGQTLAVGIWKLDESVESPVYTSALGDETFLVLEGSVRIEVVETGEVRAFAVGDVVSWSRNTPTRWTFEAPFRKLVIVSSEQPMPRPD